MRQGRLDTVAHSLASSGRLALRVRPANSGRLACSARLARMARDERGSGTVVVLALVSVVVVLALGVTTLVGAVATRTAAQSAADLSALAAAAAAQRGDPDPCSRALQVVERNASRLVACACAADLSCTVETATTTRAGRVASAAARAGPVSLTVPG